MLIAPEPGVRLGAGHLDETTGARHGTWAGAAEAAVTGATSSAAATEAATAALRTRIAPPSPAPT